MKHALISPEERRAILKKIFYALRQSPMFSHYSVEHIRDSAIKSEQLTFERSHMRQDYLHAMHAKLLKIENSYVMSGDSNLRDAEKNPYMRSIHKLSHIEGIGGPKESEDSLEEQGQGGILYSGQKRKPMESIPGFGNRRGSFSSFSIGQQVNPIKMSPDTSRDGVASISKSEGFNNYRPPNMHGGIDSRLIRENERIARENALFAAELNPKAEEIKNIDKNMQRNNLGNIPTDSFGMRSEEKYMESSLEEIKKIQMNGLEELSRIRRVEGMEKKPVDIGMIMGGIGSGMHRIGAAGSTNTVTKMNSSKERLSRSPKYIASEPSPTQVETGFFSEKSRVERREGQKSATEKKKEEDAGEEQIKLFLKDLRQMKTVIETHKELFPKKDAERKAMLELEKMLEEQIKSKKKTNIEAIQGMLHQMKKQVILLTSEIRQKKEHTFKKTLERISSAFARRKSAQPEYRFCAIDSESILDI